MDRLPIVTIPKLILANQGPAYGGLLPKMEAMESSDSQSQHAGRGISAEVFTGIIAIPLALSIGIVMSVKVGLATLAFAYLIGWALSRSRHNR